MSIKFGQCKAWNICVLNMKNIFHYLSTTITFPGNFRTKMKTDSFLWCQGRHPYSYCHAKHHLDVFLSAHLSTFEKFKPSTHKVLQKHKPFNNQWCIKNILILNFKRNHMGSQPKNEKILKESKNKTLYYYEITSTSSNKLMIKEVSYKNKFKKK